MATVRFKRTTSDKLRVYYDELKFNDTPYRYTTLSLAGNLLTVSNNIDPNVQDFTVDWADVTFPVTANAVDLQKTIQGWINEGTKEVNNRTDFIIEIDEAPEQLPCDNRLYNIAGDLWWNCQLVAIGGGGGPLPCIQSGTLTGQILVWDDINQCWEATLPTTACLEDGTQQGNTTFWDVVDNCWKETEAIRHTEIGVTLTSSGVDKNAVFISETNNTIVQPTVNSLITTSGNCTLGGFRVSLANSEECTVIGHDSSVSESYYSLVDNTNNIEAGYNTIKGSVFSDITDSWNVNSIYGSAGCQITGFDVNNPQTGTLRSIYNSAGVDVNDLVNGRRIQIKGLGSAQAIINSFVDVISTNANLRIANDGNMQAIISCLVRADNVNCGIYGTGENQLALNCLNPIINTNAEGVTVIGLQDPTITSLQPYTMYYPTETSFGGKQYRVDDVSVDTFLDFFNNIISVDTTAPVTLTLLDPPTHGQTYTIFDNLGSASTNNITINALSKTINSPTTQLTTYVIDTDYGGVTLTFDSVTDKWHLTSASLSTGTPAVCVQAGTAYGNTDFWDDVAVCWQETDAIQKTDDTINVTNANSDKSSYFITTKNSTIQAGVFNSALIGVENGTLSINTANGYNVLAGSRGGSFGAAFGADGSHNVGLSTDNFNMSGSDYCTAISNENSNSHLNTRFILGYGSALNAQGNIDGLLFGISNTSTNTRSSINIGGRNQLINHNPTAGKDNTIINSPHTALNTSAVIDFTNILQYMDDERTATNYTDNISVGGGGNIVKGGAGGAFGNGFFNSFANYVNTPVSTFAPGQIFGVNCFINSQECQLDNQFGDTAFCTFINCWQSGIINGSVANPFVANNTIIGGGVGVGSSGCTWINGGTLTESGGGVSIHGFGSQNNANQCIQIGARGLSNIDSSNRSMQLGVDVSYINNGSVACGQFTAANCLTDNSQRCGSMFVAISALGSSVGAVRAIDSLASSHCNIFTTTVASFVDLTDCEASGIRDCKFNGTLGEPNYNPVGGSWGFVNATTKSAQSMLACYNTTAEVGNNCVVMTQYGSVISDTQDNKLHVTTTRHYGGEQRKFYNTASNETVNLDETYHILFGVDNPTYVLPASPIPGQEYFFRELEDDGFVVDGNGNNIGDFDSSVAILTVLTGGGKYLHLVYNGSLWVQMLLV